MTREEIHKLPWKAQEYINDLQRKLTLTDVVVPKGTLCDGLCRVEATINAREQCVRCGVIHKE